MLDLIAREALGAAVNGAGCSESTRRRQPDSGCRHAAGRGQQAEALAQPSGHARPARFDALMPRLTCPVTIVHGTEDALIPAEQADMHRPVPGSRLVVLPRSVTCRTWRIGWVQRGRADDELSAVPCLVARPRASSGASSRRLHGRAMRACAEYTNEIHRRSRGHMGPVSSPGRKFAGVRGAGIVNAASRVDACSAARCRPRRWLDVDARPVTLDGQTRRRAGGSRRGVVGIRRRAGAGVDSTCPRRLRRWTSSRGRST
jgi:hypothetical protein